MSGTNTKQWAGATGASVGYAMGKVSGRLDPDSIATYREPTLDDARARFTEQMEAVQASYRHMTETTDPEVFAFRAARLADSTRMLYEASYALGDVALKAATK